MKYDPVWIRAQDDDTLLKEIKNLSDFNYDMAGTRWDERMDAVNQITRELLAMRAQLVLVEEHGWPSNVGPLRRRG